MARYVRYQMQHFEHCMNSFLGRSFPVWRNKALHHAKQIRVYPPRQNWENNLAPSNILHPENVAVDRNILLYPSDYLHVPQNVLN